nr:hypothetical protein [Pseudomonas sp. BIGb0427]
MQLVFLSTPFLLMLSAMAMNAYVALSRDFDLLIEAIQGNPWFERPEEPMGHCKLQVALLLGMVGLRRGDLAKAACSQGPSRCRHDG